MNVLIHDIIFLGDIMEELKENKYYRWCLWGFILITCVHLLYAVITMRGMYLDGAFFFIQLLNNFANNHIAITVDTAHPRYLVWFLTQAPVVFANFVLFIHNKYFLMMLYTFTQLALPLILIYFQYKLSLRTKRIDLYFWSLFSYCVLTITFSIFCLVETPAVTILILILLNYLITHMEYTKADIAIIVFLVFGLSCSMEFFMFVGPILFLAGFYYASKEEKINNIIIKLLIGVGSLLSTFFVFIYSLMVPGQVGEVVRFAGEGFDFYMSLLSLCSLISVGAVITLIVFLFRKEKMTKVSLTVIFAVNILLFLRLLFTLEVSLVPVIEGHLRTIPFWAVPMIVLGIVLFDYSKKEINVVKFQNYICIVLVCGIFQTSWQIVNTYFWDKNIRYLKYELFQAKEPLYLPFEHQEISSFFNPELRRYIWYNVYTPTSILFADSNKPMTLLTGYEGDAPDGNLSLREKLYVVPDKQNALFIPMGAEINIKNRYWDLTEAAIALDIYNKENNIQTER